jgi:hypothetical protein
MDDGLLLGTERLLHIGRTDERLQFGDYQFLFFLSH